MKKAESTIVFTEDLLKRFYDKTKLDETTGCLLWTGIKNPTGYGRMVINGEWFRAHRLSYMIHYGSIPDGMCVLHSCDTPSCVSKNHISIGTHAENMRQRHERGRYEYCYNGNHYLQKDSSSVQGSKNKRAVITEEIAFQILEDFRQKKFKSKAALSRAYGVSATVVKTLLCGKTWKHVPRTPTPTPTTPPASPAPGASQDEHTAPLHAPC